MKLLKKSVMVDGDCNCPECMADRDEVDYEKVCADAIAELYPYWVDALPRVCDINTGYLGRNTNLRYCRTFHQEYYIQLLSDLELIATKNKRWKAAFPDKEAGYCVDCGLIHELKNELPLNGVNRPVCQNCWDSYYLKCDYCGTLTNKHGSVSYQLDYDYDDWENGHNIKRMCRRCYTEHFLKCGRCQMPVDREHWVNISLECGHPNEERTWNMYEVDGQLMQEEDFWDMGEEEANDHIVEIRKPWAVACPHCAEDAITQCDKCGANVVEWKRMKMGWRGDVIKVCQACYHNRQVVKAYDYSVKPKFKYAPVEPTLSQMLYYGVEIEMEYPGKIVDWVDGKPMRLQDRGLEELGQEIMDWWDDDFCYIKHDGTLDFGYEAVTHPFTWNWFIDNQDKWIEFLTWLRELGFQASYYSPRKNKFTCGMHVHMSKEAFTRMHLYKFVHFMYKKSTRPFINAIAERAGSQYADFQVADSKYAVKVGKDKKNASGKRHSAINLLGGHAHEKGRAPAECQTCEVRIFQGFLEPVKFFKNMEFLQSLYEFTSCNAPRDMQVKKYLEHLLNDKGRWMALLNFIKYNDDINSSYAYVRNLMKGV
jgi:hypothetical protein